MSETDLDPLCEAVQHHFRFFRVYGPSLSFPLSSSDELSDVSAKLGSSQSDPTSSQGRR
ncbi:hypothetical protein F2Q68_00022165 [Brassica cretica]|uniref:Uncharacterized protein n=1 Tax=Brassica cretica TaxID=69181 RepID=A0A8S9FW44_BRACR|nr:hypothetical protein F2Q68_00022165 [Brassica cretica]